MNAPTDEVLGPALLGYDGSDAARGAIASASRVLGGREAVVVTVWESVGSAILRNCRRARPDSVATPARSPRT